MFSSIRLRAAHSLITGIMTMSLLLCGAGGCSRAATKPANSISAADLEVLTQYESMRAALAADNIAKAHSAGEKLLKAVDAEGVTPGIVKSRLASKIMAESYRLEVLRAAFKEFSQSLVPVCRGVDGYYIVSSELISDGVWVQTSQVIDNPYLGRSMALYGEIRK